MAGLTGWQIGCIHRAVGRARRGLSAVMRSISAPLAGRRFSLCTIRFALFAEGRSPTAAAMITSVALASRAARDLFKRARGLVIRAKKIWSIRCVGSCKNSNTAAKSRLANRSGG